MIIIAIVGMAGSGKSILSEFIRSKGFSRIRFGEFVIKEVKKRNLTINPHNEQIVREDLRKKHGMDVCATIAIPLIQKSISDKKNVVIDGLYSLSEYSLLKKEFSENIVIVAVFTPKKMRYKRLSSRLERSLTQAEAEERDYVEIKRIEKAGPIALADFTLINDGTIEQLINKMEDLLDSLLEIELQ